MSRYSDMEFNGPEPESYLLMIAVVSIVLVPAAVLGVWLLLASMGASI